MLSYTLLFWDQTFKCCQVVIMGLFKVTHSTQTVFCDTRRTSYKPLWEGKRRYQFEFAVKARFWFSTRQLQDDQTLLHMHILYSWVSLLQKLSRCEEIEYKQPVHFSGWEHTHSSSSSHTKEHYHHPQLLVAGDYCPLNPANPSEVSRAAPEPVKPAWVTLAEVGQ